MDAHRHNGKLAPVSSKSMLQMPKESCSIALGPHVEFDIPLQYILGLREQPRLWFQMNFIVISVKLQLSCVRLLTQ